jgi:hypothetical protein
VRQKLGHDAVTCIVIATRILGVIGQDDGDFFN